MIKAAWPIGEPNLLILDSRDAILDLAPLLQNLAERCGQAGAMHWLPYFLDEAVSGRRLPYLVLFLRPEENQGRSLCAQDIEAAALFFEYRIFGLLTGAVTTSDFVGFRSVIAPPGHRAWVAARAARALTQRGAAVVMATYDAASDPEPQRLLSGWPGITAAVRTRLVSRSLRLGRTYEETLAQMGKGARFNLRYYRRRLEKRLTFSYIADARELLRGADLEAINRQALSPKTNDEFVRRVRCAMDLPGSFLSGLRAEDGRWLSLVGGWRQGSTTVQQWHMVNGRFEHDSLGTVMRSYFLEDEVARGTTEVFFATGLRNSMSGAFQQYPVGDLVLRRKGLRSAALVWAANFFADPLPLFGRGNFLASMLRDRDLRWINGKAPSLKEKQAMLRKTAASERAA